MIDTPKTGLDPALAAPDETGSRRGDPPRSAEFDERERAQWVAAIIQVLQSAKTPTPKTSAEFVGAPTSQHAAAPPRWHASVGDMTHTRLGKSETTPFNVPDRLTLSVDIEDLGRLTLVVRRTPEGIRVAIGTGDRSAYRTLHAQQGALVQALQNVGLNVADVRVTGRGKVGTRLAQSNSDQEGELCRVPRKARKGGSRRRVNVLG